MSFARLAGAVGASAFFSNSTRPEGTSMTMARGALV
jgi:hypothetical protein